MVPGLVVCPSCARHVRVLESACPFCSQLVPRGLVPVPHGPRRRYVGKNATALAIAAMATAGCGGEVTSVAVPPDTGSETGAGDAASAADAGGFVITDSGAGDAAVADTADGEVSDEGGAFPVYK